jgi:transcriptional regulator with XRE-family HTH domain
MESDKSETLGQKIQRLRTAAGYSQSQFAAASKVPIGTLRNWEQDRRIPALDAATRLARVLGVSLDELAVEPVESGKQTGDADAAAPSPADQADEAAADRLGLKGQQREAYITGRRELRAEMLRQAEVVRSVAIDAAAMGKKKRKGG